jgi:hypothetical protein
MSVSERPKPFAEAYPLERRLADICTFLDRSLARGTMHLVRPGYVAATYGGGMISKAEVKEEMRKRNEAAGSAK